MKKIIMSIGVFLGLFIISHAQVLPTEEEMKKEAIKVAESWIILVDSTEYGLSWDQAAQFFRNAVQKEKWESSLASILPTFGKVLNREVLRSSYKTELPGAPDGEYVVIKYRTKFEHKAKTIETVTVLKEKDGSWHVSGYFIK